MYQVLVVEDEPLIRDAIVEMVQQMDGFKVTGEAASCEEGWRLVQELWPTLLITDIQLPDADGLELIHRIREQKLPIVSIIVSGHDNFPYAQHAIRLHVSEYLLKPISEQELHASIKRSLSRLESFAEPNQLLLDMQAFVDRMPEYHSVQLFERVDRIIDAIFGSRSGDQGAMISYCNILAGKLADCVKAIYPAFREAEMQPGAGRQQFRMYVHGLLHEWIKQYSLFAGNNMKLVIARACDYMERHLHEEIALSQIAEYSNLSASYFGVLFKQHTGRSFVNYFNQLRMDKAMELLRNPDLKIYEVAESVGFVSLPYFNRVFKQQLSMTPNEYRKSLGL
ncbi:response regulator [Paenibacillus sp. PAMC21692]|uniref:response regulator n=1 Tax=Paenibacillus sp. PAMC21692 TaxID=2762320 RepID=UPI00164E8647|nr:response regulator [Paenibacillus sp. PAMC21692]QNK58319.1 response regulator [Paenibacillus sp. PAMC21692]